MLIPAFKAAGARLRTRRLGAAASAACMPARKFGFAQATDRHRRADRRRRHVDAVVIATRHDSTRATCCEALAAGKHVFVEKPLCLTLDELARHRGGTAPRGDGGRGAVLMVGFNRRFAPQVQQDQARCSPARRGPRPS